MLFIEHDGMWGLLWTKHVWMRPVMKLTFSAVMSDGDIYLRGQLTPTRKTRPRVESSLTRQSIIINMVRGSRSIALLQKLEIK